VIFAGRLLKIRKNSASFNKKPSRGCAPFFAFCTVIFIISNIFQAIILRRAHSDKSYEVAKAVIGRTDRCQWIYAAGAQELISTVVRIRVCLFFCDIKELMVSVVIDRYFGLSQR
jgi:hypothetical protein